MFTDEQRQILLRYYEDGMTSTKRKHMDLIEKCATECNTPVERIKVGILDIVLMYYYIVETDIFYILCLFTQYAWWLVMLSLLGYRIWIIPMQIYGSLEAN